MQSGVYAPCANVYAAGRQSAVLNDRIKER